MTLAPALERRMASALAVIILVTALASAYNTIHAPGVYRPAFLATVVTLLVLPYSWLIAALVHGTSPRRSASTLLGVGALVALLHLIVPADLRQVDAIPLESALVGLSCLGAIFRARRVVAWFLVIPSIMAVARLPLGMPRSHIVANSVLCAMAGVGCWGIVGLLARCAGLVAEEADATWRERELLSRAEHRAREHASWDGLVHDKVLGSLRLAGRGLDDAQRRAAKELADEALSALQDQRTSEIRTAELADQWKPELERIARATGLSPTLIVEAPPQTARARTSLLTAAHEALSNVARHSGQDRVEIVGVSQGTEYVLEVRDSGRGFTPADVSARSLGIRSGIVERLMAVGGHAAIESRPGQGTTVRLRVADTVTGDRPDAPTLTWDERVWAPLVALGALHLLLHCVFGLTLLSAYRWPWVPVAGVMVVPLVGLGLLKLPRGGAAWWPLAAVAALLPGALTLAMADPAPHDWRYWFIGASDVAIILVAFRFSGRVAAVVASLMIGGTVLAQAMNGG